MLKIKKIGDIVKIGDIEGKIVIRGGCIEIILKCGTFIFDEEGDLLMMITPRKE